MAEDDSFLTRWARRKHAQKVEKPAAEEVVKPQDMPANKTAGKPAAAPTEGETIDLASLPPIESLGAESDYTVFLRPGVPDSLRLAALRQLWLTEPSIRNYEALVDYAWDFNAPGYGKLLPTDDVEKLLKAVFREDEPVREKPAATEEPPAQQTAAPPADTVRRSDSRPAVASPPPTPDATAPSGTPAEPPVAAAPDPPRRRHGAALPRRASDADSG